MQDVLIVGWVVKFIGVEITLARTLKKKKNILKKQ